MTDDELLACWKELSLDALGDHTRQLLEMSKTNETIRRQLAKHFCETVPLFEFYLDYCKATIISEADAEELGRWCKSVPPIVAIVWWQSVAIAARREVVTANIKFMHRHVANAIVAASNASPRPTPPAGPKGR